MKYFNEPQGTWYRIEGDVFCDSWYRKKLERSDEIFSKSNMSPEQIKDFLKGIEEVARENKNAMRNLWYYNLTKKQREFVDLQDYLHWYQAVLRVT